MSTFYKESNNETAFELFNKRKVYTYSSYSKDYPNLTNFVAEKILYGRVDRLFTPITIPEGSARIKNISSKSNRSQGFRALDFVVDACTDLQKQFEKCRNLGQIDPNDDYLSSLQVYKAYVDPYRLYENYINIFNSKISTLDSIDSANIKDFDTLSKNLLTTMNKTGKTNPLTFPAFVKSRKVPINISGLAIEIADLSASNDKEKYDKFINSPNWKFYLNTCRTYGFMVDLDVPWRLVADIGSSAMLQYARKYLKNADTNSILFNYYERSYSKYYSSFTQRMYKMYYNIKPTNIIKLNDCNGRIKTERIKPTEYKNIEKLEEKYGQESFLVLYCKLRFTEEESQYTEEQKSILIKDIIQLTKNKTQNYAIGEFERFLNKTFDYQGSLGYYVKANRIREEKEIFEEDGSTGTMSTTGTTQTTGY